MKTFLAALVAVVALGAFSTGSFAHADPKPAAGQAQPAAQQVRCPVTGDVVADPAHAAKSEYKGRTYYFCCPGCKPMFDKDPEKYVGKAGAEPAPAGTMTMSGK